MSTESHNPGSARDAILQRMRQSLARSRNGEAHEVVRARLSNPAPTLIPARADLGVEARIRLFTEQAEAVQASVERIGFYAELPATIAGYLRRQNLPMQLVKAVDDDLAKADWEGGIFEIRDGRPKEDDPVGLTTAFAGIAETGTLMLTSDADHPTMLAFLPETAIIVLASDRVCRAYEDALHSFRAAGRNLPRSVNLITGPSRSGDIEQTLQLGAHGPRRLLAILVDEPGEDGPIATIGRSEKAR